VTSNLDRKVARASGLATIICTLYSPTPVISPMRSMGLSRAHSALMAGSTLTHRAVGESGCAPS
jgi:hypothetical protein